MKALSLILAVGLTLSIPVAFAQDEKEDHSTHHPAQKAEAVRAQPSGGDHDASKSSPVQENMRNIERLLQQTQEANDPAQKRQFLSEHLQALRDQMRLIRSQNTSMKMSMNEEGMKEDGMKDDGMKEGMMKKGGMMGGMMMHKKVEQRLDMLERMMQQVIEREAAQESIEQH
ncbi:MAG: hypothetical protein ABI612_12440 [Betaproteobacteria bacterium]